MTRRVHTAEHLASAMFWLGVPQGDIPRAKLAAGPKPDLPPYAVIHPFASAPDKTWPAARFLEVARHLKERCGLAPVILAGPSDDPGVFADYRVWHNQPLDQVKNLLAGAQMFVGNDSGPAHIAAAFGVPVVAIFTASDPVIWGPWRTESQVLTGVVPAADAIAAVEALKVRA